MKALIFVAALFCSIASARADIGAQWDFVPNLGYTHMTVDWDPTNGGVWHWLRNPNSSTASMLPIYGWSGDLRQSPALQDMNYAELWLVVLPRTNLLIRLVHFRDGFKVETIVKTLWYGWSGYNWQTMRLNVTAELRALAEDVWASPAQPGHHLGVQIMGAADIRRATLTIQ